MKTEFRIRSQFPKLHWRHCRNFPSEKSFTLETNHPTNKSTETTKVEDKLLQNNSLMLLANNQWIALCVMWAKEIAFDTSCSHTAMHQWKTLSIHLIPFENTSLFAIAVECESITQCNEYVDENKSAEEEKYRGNRYWRGAGNVQDKYRIVANDLGEGDTVARQ